MRILGKILKIFLMVLGTLIVFLCLLLYTFLWKPQWFLNDKTLRLAANFSAKFGAVVTWQSSTIQVESHGLLHKRVDLSFRQLCFNFSENKKQGCIETLRFAGEAAWLKGRMKILGLGPFLIDNGRVMIHQEAAKEEVKEEVEKRLELTLPDLVLPDFLKTTVFRGLSLDFTEIVIWKADEVLLSGRAKLVGEIDDRGRLQKITLNAVADPSDKLPSGELNAEVLSPSYFMENDWLLKAKADLKIPAQGDLTADLTAQPVEKAVYRFSLDADFHKDKLAGKAALNATLRQGAFVGSFSASAAGFVQRVQKITAQNCQFNLREIGKIRDRLRFDLDCPLVVDLTPMRVPSATLKKLVTIPYQLDFLVKTDMETAFYPSLDKPVSGTLDVTLKTFSQELLSAQGTTRTKFSGIPSQYPKGWQLKTKMDMAATLPRFKRLVDALERTAFPIFAPLNDLDGTAEFKFSGEADIAGERGKIPVVFNTRLRSAEQAFDMDGKGELQYQLAKAGGTAQLKMDLDLSDLKIVMPRFGYTSLPALFPDARFKDPKKVPVVRKGKTNLTYQIHVKTPPDHPARFISNLAKENIPLFVDLTLDEKKMSGTVKVGLTQLDFFRRNAKVEKFNLDLGDPMAKSIVDGQIRVAYADYTIDIFIVGSVERPKVIFQSDPPLDQEQILSVLIYGRTFEDLNSDNASSVSSVSAAMADRALALGSLFLLASSPIESVSYDPSTKAFSAKVKIAQGTSMEIGTREGKTQELGFRKSLKGNWLIRTYIENDTEESKQRGGAFLEWYKRY